MAAIEIFCENNNQYKDYPLGITLMEIATDMNIKTEFPICGAMVNNKVRELSYCIVKPKNIRFIDYSNRDGKRMYTRSLFFLLYVAVKDLYPDLKLKIDHTISKGFYCEIDGCDKEFYKSCIGNIKTRMEEIVDEDHPFIRHNKQMEKVLAEYQDNGLDDKIRLYEDSGLLYANIYYLNGYVNYFHGHLLPSTTYLRKFDLEQFDDGMLIRLPSNESFSQLRSFVREDKLFEIFQEHKEWAEILGINDIGRLNSFVKKGSAGEVIKISEALHEKRIASIATIVSERTPKVKLILIAGPSSSGKTTFTKRLAVQLAVCGITAKMISLDNYFVDREHTPKDENGNLDFESLYAIDIDFFNKQLNQMLNGEEVEIPKFSFTTGNRSFDGSFIKLDENQVLIIEGIHGLNPDLLPMIDPSLTFKIFISALTSISIDDLNPISPTDNRQIRRMIRDSQYRGISALETIKRWPSVRRGEELNIFPHQENADIMFNTATLYELGVLKKYAEPLLKSVPENQPQFAESLRLMKLLSYFKDIDGSEIPPTSLVREFLGGSSFNY